MTKEEMLELRAMMADVVKDELIRTLDGKFDAFRAEIDTKMEAQQQRLTAKLDTLRTEMRDENQKLFMNIVDVVETQTTRLGLQYEHEVAEKINALNEETNIIRSDVKDHDQRIFTVERKVGLAI